MEDSIVNSATTLVSGLVQSFIANGKIELARDAVSRLRKLCDELTHQINVAARDGEVSGKSTRSSAK